MNVVQKIKRIENSLPDFDNRGLLIPVAGKGHHLFSEMTRLHIPGLVVAVINDFTLDWTKGYGVLASGSDRFVNPDSIFQACSVSKMVTAGMVMRFVEQGLLDLDLAINQILQTWRLPENEFTRDHPVTLRHLLAHTSGINRPDGGFDWEPQTEPSLLQILDGEPPACGEPARIIFQPGSTWMYANFGYIVIQQILEDSFGVSFESLIKKKLFDEIGMHNSTFKYPLSRVMSEREISLHDTSGQITHPGMIPSAVAHGGLMTTAGDLAEYGIALMNSYQGVPGSLWKKSTLLSMFEPQVKIKDQSIFGFPFQMGLGVFIVESNRQRYYFHPGENDPGATSILVVSPETGAGAAIMTNGSHGYQIMIQLLLAIAAEYQWVNR